ncbi:efflux RND transporter permease subunit [Selenihalanaerobacter shriftii]|uniref:SSD domain-containing protein n=1 Tax=Selenihalanaerobacter shriftii TaxID=142842 RepID=A0A1T4JU10_9FIRM|nr:MMPL family transporter [Selenihalanaerobacter shriftii]SJZ33631.1 hypothetical protein SAMN02745118_00408 [Selenihalanaerobacter shriftii]
MRKIFKHSWIVILVILIITGFFATQLPKLKINNEFEIFLPQDHPARVANDEMEKIYGSSDRIVVAINVKRGTIFTKENVALVKKMTDEFEMIKHVDEIDSITNTDYIDGTSEGMKVAELAKKVPENRQKLFDLKRKLISWDLYKNNFYSSDFKATQLMIKLNPGLTIKEKEAVYFKVKDKLKKYKKSNLEMYVAGTPAVNVLMGKNMQSDVKRLIPFVILVVLIALFLSFKNIGGVVMPIMTVLISTVWSLGIMAMLGINLTMVSTVIPVLLVAVGSTYGIHIISHYYDDIRSRKEAELTEIEHTEIVLETVSKVGKPVFLAGITTIAGFGSLATSNIVPIRDFGIFTAIGVATALIVAITLIPAILIVRHKKSSYSKNSTDKESILNKITTSLYDYLAQNRIGFLTLILVIIILSAVGMSQIVTDSIMVEMFKETTDIRKADKFINNHFSGTNILNVLVEGEGKGKGKGSLTDPDVLKAMDDLGGYLKRNHKEVGKVTSFANFIKRMNKVMHYPQEEMEDSKQDSVISNETTSNFGNETTGSFGEESTSDFGKETTSNFDEETTSNFGEETTSSFGKETTSDFGQESTINSNKKNEANTNQQGSFEKAPSNRNISEKDLITLLNKSLVKAKRLNLTGEELVQSINKELNYKGEAYNEVPYDPTKYPAKTKKGLKNLVSQYLLLYSGSLDDYINDQLEPSKARMMLQLKTGSNIVAKKIQKDINQYVETNFPEGYKTSVAGHVNMSLAVNNLIVSSQILSIIVSLVIVFLIVTISYRSFVAGIFGIIPLAFSLLINFGIMGFAGIKLDVGTSMVASIAIGIGVDYTVHFLSAYSYERKRSNDLTVVTHNTLTTAGKAIIFNAISVAAGFAVLLFSNFIPLVNLGLLVSVTMVTSSLASMTVLPVLLNLFQPKFVTKQGGFGNSVNDTNYSG